MSDVSRETPAVPDVARRVFHVGLPQAERYAELLSTEGVVRGVIGPRETPRLWDRHLLNCAVLGEVIPESPHGGSVAPLTVADIGSGAGLPGVVLAIARPDLQITLVEPLLRRTRFLTEIVAELGLGNVEIVRARAEEVRSRRFGIVTSRAVAPLAKLAAWSLPLVEDGGMVLALKGSSVQEEVARDSASLRRMGVSSPEVLEIGGDVLQSPTFVCRLVRDRAAAVDSRGDGGAGAAGSVRARGSGKGRRRR